MQFVSTLALVTALGMLLSAAGASPPSVSTARATGARSSDSVRTSDPLTGLPLDPATMCQTQACVQFHAGNEPVKIPDARWCKSTMQANFYGMNNVKLSATVAWYAAHLHGFKRTHAYASGRSDDTFYNSAGTLFVLVMGNPASEGADPDTYSVTYYRVQPALREKSIVGFNRQKSVCS